MNDFELYNECKAMAPTFTVTVSCWWSGKYTGWIDYVIWHATIEGADYSELIKFDRPENLTALLESALESLTIATRKPVCGS